MFIVIDKLPSGHEMGIYHGDGDVMEFDHPSNNGTKTDIEGVLKHHNDNPQSREIGGWHVLNQLDGEDKPITRWQRLVNNVNKLHETHPLRALNLK